MELPSLHPPSPTAEREAPQGLRLPAPGSVSKRHWAASFPGMDVSLSKASPEPAWTLHKCGTAGFLPLEYNITRLVKLYS